MCAKRILVFRWLCVGMLACCSVMQATGQLTARDADREIVTSYINTKGYRDTIFVFNQTPQPKKGTLSLQYQPSSSIVWTIKNTETFEYDTIFVHANVVECKEELGAGEYRIIVNICSLTEIIECKVDTVNNGDDTYTVTVISDNLQNPDIQINSEPKGTLTVRIDPFEFNWYSFDYDAKEFATFKTEQAYRSSAGDLEQGGYKVTVTPHGYTAPCDSFVAWLYMNPGFEFKLRKSDDGKVMSSYKNCGYTDFRFDPKFYTVQSSFIYYHPVSLAQMVLNNEITFTMKPDKGQEVVTRLHTQGNFQSLLDYDPPYEDTQYFFRAYDSFGVERKDEILYETIIPYATIDPPVLPLPEEEQTSAPVPVKFTCETYNVAEYVWRFGNGDSVVYNPDRPAPDTIRYTYYTPKRELYQITLKVASQWDCTHTTEPVTVKVDAPRLEVGTVFTPNDDGINDFFKPEAISLRGFEIIIFTRTGKRVFYYRGDDLRSWKGWDGRIENSGKEAAEGIYFYTIRAFGWDNPPTKNPQAGPYKGSFYLYR